VVQPPCRIVPAGNRETAQEGNQPVCKPGRLYRPAGEIFDEFFGQNRPEKISPLLDKILRIRAVQDFMPSGAIQFVFQLKKIARQILQAEIVEGGVTPGDMFEFDDKVDVLALAAMDVYVGCRENLYRVRVEEIKNRTSRLLHRAGIIADVRSQKPEDEQQ